MALAAPISGTLYEGKAGAVHDEKDPLVYFDGPEYRTLDEVESIAAQLPGKPFTLLHPEGMVGDGAEADIIGTVVGGRVDGGYAVATIMVSSKAGLDAIKSNTYALSLGYRCTVDSGRFQRKIVIDHLALVPRGRCTTCFLRKDSADACLHEEQNMKLGTMEVEVKVTGLDELNAAVESLKSVTPVGSESKADCACKNHAMPHTKEESMSDTTLADEMTALKTKLDEAHAALSKLEIEATNARKDAEVANAKLTEALALVESTKADASSSVAQAKTDADAAIATELAVRVDARVALLVEAAAVLKGADLKGMDDRAIKCAVIKHVDGDEVAESKSMDYVTGVYEGALKRANAAGASRDTVRTVINEMRKDNAPVSPADAEKAARDKMKADSQNAWVK